MKKNNIKILTGPVIIICVAAIILLTPPAYCQDDSMVLLVQQSPVQGGTVTPGMGVHKFAPGEEVVLTAVPQSGYQFVYWIGDVSDPTTRRTVVYLDSPKIVIAVFERSKFDFLATDELAQSQPGGGLFPSPSDYGNQGFAGSGGAARNPNFITPPMPPEPQNNFPVPPNNETNDFPVPPTIPEPATFALFSVGALGFLRKRK